MGRAARREVNINESISAFETALCEMRPETLETDLKKSGCNNNNTNSGHQQPQLYGGTSFSPYVQHDDSLPMDSSNVSIGGTSLHLNVPESKMITYQNYLFPASPIINSAGAQLQQHGLRVNCSDEESISTNQTSATNTTESTMANSNVSPMS